MERLQRAGVSDTLSFLHLCLGTLSVNEIRCVPAAPSASATDSRSEEYFFPPTQPSRPSLCDLTVCSMCLCPWIWFVHKFILFIRFHIGVRSCESCLSRTGSFRRFFFLLNILATSLPTWSSLRGFCDIRLMIIYLRQGLWLYSIKVINDVANNPFHIFLGRDYLHKQAI